MGILDNIKGLKPGGTGASGSTGARSDAASSSRAGATRAPRGKSSAASEKPGSAIATGTSPAMPRTTRPGSAAGAKLPGKRKRKGAPASPRERVAAAAAPLHDRRRRLVGARETTLRDLGGLMLEMYKRNRFREELLLDKCEEVLAIEVEIAHVDQRLFQLAPPNAAGMRPIGRCECGAPIHPGQNFCGVCGRSFATLTLARSCSRCGGGLRPGDQFCATCGNEAPDALQAIEAGPGTSVPMPDVDAASMASKAVADTVVIEAQVADAPPPLEDVPAPAAASAAADEPDSLAPPSALPTANAPQGAVAEPEVPAPAPQAAPAGFDWAVPPPAAEAAIDTAVAAMPTSPTDPGTPFAGFPLSSTVPPPPIVDPIDVMLPTEPAVTVGTTGQASAMPAASAPAAPGRPAAASADDAAAKDAKAADRAAKKAEAAAEKQRLKEARARAKAKAKQARAARKRGGDG